MVMPPAVALIANAGAAAAAAYARDHDAVTHGHVIVLAHIPDLAGTGAGAGANTAAIAQGFTGDPTQDHFDAEDPRTLVIAVAAHLTELIRQTGVDDIHVITRPFRGDE